MHVVSIANTIVVTAGQPVQIPHHICRLMAASSTINEEVAQAFYRTNISSLRCPRRLATNPSQTMMSMQATFGCYLSYVRNVYFKLCYPLTNKSTRDHGLLPELHTFYVLRLSPFIYASHVTRDITYTDDNKYSFALRP